MQKLDVSVLKQLYANYSPFMTNEELVKAYRKITNKNISSERIREEFNQKIQKGLLNEAIIKAELLKSFCFNKNPINNIVVFEYNTGNSRADLCVFNGKSIVFEIKTEFDTFNRLQTQLSDYLKTYQYLYLVIPRVKLDEALVFVKNENIGILIYEIKRNRLSFETIREPHLNKSIDSQFQLNLLTKSQLAKYQSIPIQSKDMMIESILLNHSREEINTIFIKETKNKFKKKWLFVYENRYKIKPLDFQWFYKNNVSVEAIYV